MEFIKTIISALFIIPISLFCQTQITIPNDNYSHKYEVGKKILLTWYADNVDFVDIEYSTNSGKSWNMITTRLPAIDSTYMAYSQYPIDILSPKDI